ncbi:8145_t:CDS:2 [Entrophospora sp. SA101]|nr:8145_t:CDS:2 [Entrophospora sp. SA101]
MFILHERSRLKIVLILINQIARGYFPGCVKISQHFRKSRALAYFAIRQKVKGKYSSTVRIAPNRTVELINGRTPKTIDIDVKPKGIAYLGGLLD